MTRICVLQSSNEGSAVEFAELDPYRTPDTYDKGRRHAWEHAYIKKSTAVQQIRDLVRSKKFDVFLNLCDGAFDEDRAGQEVVDALERYGAAYTGADAVFYEPSKELMKKMAYYYDIPTPAFAFIYDIDMQDDGIAKQQVSDAVEGLNFPLIVKHYNGYSSVGMGKDCKVHDMEQLMQQVRKFVSAYGGALVEEFIVGREFTVLVVEGIHDSSPFALIPVECRFAPGEDFKHFDLKWKEYESMTWVPIDTATESELDVGLRAAAVSAFIALRGCSYGRADFRVDANGKIYFLEMNPNCGILYGPDCMGSADYILSFDPQMDHAKFIDHILEVALAKQQRKQPLTNVLYKHGVGYGMYTARDFEEGEVVVRYECRPHVLISTTHARRIYGEHALPGPCPIDNMKQKQSGPAQVNGNHTATDETLPEAQSDKSTEQRQLATDENGSSIDNAHYKNGKKQDENGVMQLNDIQRRQAEWFKAYAYPLTDQVWVTWSEDPNDWLPINHSCDPTTWLDGLNLVAKRPLKKGVHVTMDYATFCVHNMDPFHCKCGATNCRGVIKGTDYLEPWVEKVRNAGMQQSKIQVLISMCHTGEANRLMPKCS